MRALSLLSLLILPAALSAQAGGTKTPPAGTQTRQETKAAPATKSAAPQTKGATPQSAASKTAGVQTKGAPAAANTRTQTAPGTGTKAGAAGDRGLAVAPEIPARQALPPLMREVYDYEPAGRRDPFLSLLTSEDLRPAITDLRVVNIIYDESGRRPIAVLREAQTNTQYRVTTGSTLGRLRVALIKRRVVIFSIEEFGLNRQDSLILGDTSKVRAR